jgi:protein-L-isoaspartate(D-aspartate) O-methyltransferase
VGSVTDDRLHQYATNVTAYVSDPAVVDAFTRVPREHFVRAVIGKDGRPVPVTLDQVYSDEALVTRVRDGLPSSSSSQPSLMAEMLAALRLRPGDRVLEVGTGTGYNAALIATITGVPVVTLDVQADVVADAAAALARAGIEGTVTAVCADGYLGAPDHGPFDRIVATVGIGGIPPAWLDQLAPGGLILAPVEHGGIQPCVTVTASRSGPVGGLRGRQGESSPAGRGALRSGFMLAAGRLHPWATAPEAIALPDPPQPVPMPAVAQNRYYELWFGLAAWDDRVERRLAGDLIEGVWPGPATACTVTDADAGSVVVGLDALYPVRAAEDLVTHVRTLVERWHAAGGPRVGDWYCDFTFGDGLWTPTRWRLGP